MSKRSWKVFFSITLFLSVLTVGFGFPKTSMALGTLERLSGSNRINTAIAIAKRLYPTSNSANAVVLARHDDYADALSATSLAGLANGPVLLNPGKSGLDASVKQEIDRLLSNNKTIYIIGGTAALPSSIDTALNTNYKVKRIAGADRYDTAKKIKLEGDTIRGSTATEALITRGDNFPDALSVSSYSAYSGTPIILVKQNEIPKSSTDVLNATMTTAYIIGGTAAVTDQVKAQLENLISNVTTRIAGANRYATSAAVADFFFANPIAISVATGVDYPDALAGGVLAGKTNLSPFGMPMLLTKPDRLPTELSAYLTSHAATIDNSLSGYIYGGFAAITQDVEFEIENLI